MPAGGLLFVTKKKRKVLGVSTHSPFEFCLFYFELTFGSTPKPRIYFEMNLNI
jgi:hypothetical protein